MEGMRDAQEYSTKTGGQNQSTSGKKVQVKRSSCINDGYELLGAGKRVIKTIASACMTVVKLNLE